jgi:predicted transcriptional regulator
MKYRSTTEIIDTMLRSVKSGATKTSIMYRAYMSYAQLKEYLKLLEERHMIAFEPQSQLYHITEKGIRFINAYEKISELVPSVTDAKSSESKTPGLYLATEPNVFKY